MSDYSKNRGDYEEVKEITISDSLRISAFISRVYRWMFLALSLTAIIAFILRDGEIAYYVASNKLLFYGLLIGELLLVGALASRIHKISFRTAVTIFFVYSALNGVTFSVLLGIFEIHSIALTFALTAGTFGIMSLVGYFTKTDLTSFGKILLMALIGVILATIVNLFMRSSMLDYIISFAGVAIFTGLIAYDTQKIKRYAEMGDETDRNKLALMGALALYLDFVNLFIYLLRLFGSRR